MEKLSTRGKLFSCLCCKTELWSNSFTRHMRACSYEKPQKKKYSKNYIYELKCDFCFLEFRTKKSKSLHQYQCVHNINRIPNGNQDKKGRNHYTNGTAKPLTHEQRMAMSKRSRGRIWSDKSKQKLSESMKIAVQKYPESYNSGNRGRTKQIEIDGIKFHGSWEVLFYNWCQDNSINCKKNRIGFTYEFEGTRTYYPDFYLVDYDVYVEIKGYKVDKDVAKWNQFSKKLIILENKEIKLIKKNEFLLESML